jgi:transcriptional regulator with XRE-family HTH domain
MSEPLTGKDLRDFRLQHGLTQHAMADVLGLHLNTLSRWETGERMVGHPKLMRLALDALHAKLTMRRVVITTSSHTEQTNTV